MGLLASACGPKGPALNPTAATDAERGIRLRYLGEETTLEQETELQLTHTSVGQYVDASLKLTAGISLKTDGERLTTDWRIRGIDPLELEGTTAPGDVEKARELLLAHGKGGAIGDPFGVIDVAATDALPLNQIRTEALTDPTAGSPAAALVMGVLAEQLRLPRLPPDLLEPGTPVVVEEESETVVTDAELVLPTTTVYRYTLLKVDDSGTRRVAELSIEIANVAQSEGGPEDEDEDTEPEAKLESKVDGTLLFDVDQGLPVSVELNRSETFKVGKLEGERSLLVRTQYRDP